MEVGRHPRAADPPRRRDVHLVARRGAGHRALPRAAAPAARLPDGTVIDGEIVAFDGERPLPFAVLQRRIGRQKLTPAVLRDAPAGLLAYDLLEDDGTRRPRAAARRAARAARRRSSQAMGAPCALSPAIDGADWAELAAVRERSREHAAEGLMLKRSRRRTSSAASAATGGSGRSIRTAWTRC